MKISKDLTSERLREALSESGLTQADLSAMSSVNKVSISQYLKGTHSPTNVTAFKMAKVLNVRAEWLMGLDDRKRISPNYIPGTAELVDLFSKATEEQRKAVLQLLRSFVQE